MDDNQKYRLRKEEEFAAETWDEIVRVHQKYNEMTEAHKRHVNEKFERLLKLYKEKLKSPVNELRGGDYRPNQLSAMMGHMLLDDND